MNSQSRRALIAGFLVLSLAFTVAQTNPVEINKTQARKLFEVALNQDNWEIYNDLHTKDFVAHSGKVTEGLAEDLRDAKGWRQAFPNGQYSILHVIAEGNYVTVHFVGRGANTGPWQGMPATGKSVEVYGVTIFRFENGKMAEEWTEYNMLSLLKQLGLAPN